MALTVFVVDDDAIQLEMTAQILRDKYQYEVMTALGGRAAIERFLLRSHPAPDIVLLDLMMPDVSGCDVVKAIRRSDPHIPIVLLSPREQHALVMEAIRAGASECLQKPANIHYLKLTIDKHVQREHMRRELSRLERYQRCAFDFSDIIGQSEAMQCCLRQAKEAASQCLPVAIHGEQGTGKELLARVIHSQGAHRHGHFVALDAFKDSTPFTDEWLAGNGTLLLRHIDAMPLAQQEMIAPLITALRRGKHPLSDKIRLIATSREPLADAYRKGNLHEAIFYAFDTQTISLPPLRERAEDVVLLANYYLARFTASYPFAVRRVDDAAAKLLRTRDWQGNVLELISLMQRAAYYAHEPELGSHILSVLIEHPDMPALTMMQIAQNAYAPAAEGDYRLLTARGDMKPFEEIEADVIRFAISHYRGKMTQVARKLGIGRSTLYRKMQDYKLRSEEEVAA